MFLLLQRWPENGEHHRWRRKRYLFGNRSRNIQPIDFEFGRNQDQIWRRRQRKTKVFIVVFVHYEYYIYLRKTPREFRLWNVRTLGNTWYARDLKKITIIPIHLDFFYGFGIYSISYDTDQMKIIAKDNYVDIYLLKRRRRV